MMLQQLAADIPPFDEEAAAHAQARQERLTKPPGSLGRLEALAVQLAGITAKAQPTVTEKVIIVMAGDHGVVAEGVSAYPQVVTCQMVANFLAGGAAINVLARHAGARLRFVDMGVAADLPPHPALLDRKVGFGTGNIARGPAMSRKEAERAILSGVETVGAEIAAGLDIVATGDMGIGNTTPSAAIAAALTGVPAAEIVGRGTGVDDAGLKRKVTAVQRALSHNRPQPEDGLDVLAKVGGFEIGGLAGVILGAAAQRKPVLIDGFISTAAAMIAAALAPQVRPYLIAAHCSQEKGHQVMLNWLRLQPLLNLDLRLGEGTGAALACSLLEAACKLHTDMATFAEAGVSTALPESSEVTAAGGHAEAKRLG